MHRAAIDLGSNSVLLTILDENENIIHDEARVVGLGKGLGDSGQFAPDRMSATEEALRDYAEIVLQHGLSPKTVLAITTSAARRASNAGLFFGAIERNTGLQFQIISGEEEARLTWLGATSDVNEDGRVAVFDLGGGSTEVVVGTKFGIEDRISLEIGSVRHTEAFLGFGTASETARDNLRSALRKEIRRITFDLKCDTAIGVAGTVTTLAAMELGLKQWDSERVHHSVISADALKDWADRLSRVDRSERERLAAVSPKRADYLVAGAEILIALLATCQKDELKVSDRGIRFGLLHSKRLP